MRATVLLVEDHRLNRELLIQLLEDDYDIVTRADGRAGLDAALEIQPNLILLDLSLPILDGWEVARRIRLDSEMADVPILALTAHAMAGDEEKALAAGCDAYLTKPIDETTLLEIVERLLGR